MRLLAAVLMMAFLVGCAGGGFDPKAAHPDAWEAARGQGTPETTDTDTESDE